MADYRYQKGSTLIEVLTAFAVLGIVAVGVAQFYGQANQVKQKMRIRAIQESIAKDVENKLRTPSAIYMSLLHRDNLPLLQCLEGVGSGCTKTLTTPPARKNPRYNFFALVYPTSLSTFDPISSATAKSIYYSITGERGCKKEDNACIFEVKTFYYTVCPIKAASKTILVSSAPSECQDGAEEIKLAYRVTQVKDFKVNRDVLVSKLPEIPESINFSTITAREIFGPQVNMACNQGAVIVGYDKTGKVRCECRQPYVVAPVPGNRKGPLCNLTEIESFKCAEGQVYKGLNAQGTANCVALEDAYDCKSFCGTWRVDTQAGACTKENYDRYFAEPTCGPDYWVSMTRRRNCKFACAVGKGGGSCNADEHEDAVNADSLYLGDLRDVAAPSHVYQSVGINEPDELDSTYKNQIVSLMKPGETWNTGTSDKDPRKASISPKVRHAYVCDFVEFRCCKPK